jgi:predicted peroxiredoxin
MIKYGTCFAAASLILLLGCNGSTQVNAMPSASNEIPIVLLSITSDANENPQSIDMAMKLAGFSLDEGRKVVMFFNVKAVTIPVKNFSDDFAFQTNDPIKSQLMDLIKRGVDVHVCPICMKALGVKDSDVLQGAKVTTRPSLFANIQANTVVFTY